MTDLLLPQPSPRVSSIGSGGNGSISSMTVIVSRLPVLQRIRLYVALVRLRILDRLTRRILMQQSSPISIQDMPETKKEEIIAVIASTRWARNIAEGQATLAGLTPGTPEYERFTAGYARNMARRFLGLPTKV